MTWSARFQVTEVADGKIHAEAKVEDGTLNQNTEHVTSLEMVATVEDGHETAVQVGDTVTGSGHFSG